MARSTRPHDDKAFSQECNSQECDSQECDSQECDSQECDSQECDSQENDCWPAHKKQVICEKPAGWVLGCALPALGAEELLQERDCAVAFVSAVACHYRLVLLGHTRHITLDRCANKSCASVNQASAH